MTPRQKIEVEQSQKRERINALLGQETRSEVEATELGALTTRMQEIEPLMRAAIVAEPDGSIQTRTDESAEGRERRALIDRCHVGSYFASAIRGGQLDGAEAELSAEIGSGRDIPFAVAFERRAITPAGSDVSVNQANIEQIAFAPPVASRLGIALRDVPSGTAAIPRISTAPSSAAPKGKGGSADATAGAIVVVSSTAKRIPARLSVALEDIAAFGSADFESALRQALQANLESSFDDQVLTGSGSGANLSGLIDQLTAATVPSDVLTWANGQEELAAGIDGIWARRYGDLAAVVNAEAYRKAAGTYQAPMTSGANGENSLAATLEANLAEFFTSARMPNTDSNIARVLIARRGQSGLSTAVVPVWDRVSIDDPYSNAGEGQRHFTVSLICGDLLLVQPDAFVLRSWKLA